jgi:pimeloyl-ACP methyl ester carboxylesterase
MGGVGFEGYELSQTTVGDVSLRVRVGGAGPPLLLLHGYPETHWMWAGLAGDLAREFTVVAPDLRGYGDSSKPPTVASHETYGKRAMAADGVALMRQLGFDRFDVVGHDRGGRAAYRMALDFPDVVRRLTVMDVIPTGEVWARADARFALGYWHYISAGHGHNGTTQNPGELDGTDPTVVRTVVNRAGRAVACRPAERMPLPTHAGMDRQTPQHELLAELPSQPGRTVTGGRVNWTRGPWGTCWVSVTGRGPNAARRLPGAVHRS